MTNNSIVIALSGGVDSSVSAYLLKEHGYDVHAIFMKNWEEDDTEDYCSAAEDIADASRVCDVLNIPFHTVNFSSEYWDNVFESFLHEYQSGRTPNPDILCNKEIKFKAFLHYAATLGIDRIATGHYAGIRYNSNQGQHLLLRAQDTTKDQSYFLYTLTQQQLAKTIFPLSNTLKTEVRNIAQRLQLPNHAKKDSTGICFIGERKFKEFLQRYCLSSGGNMCSIDDGSVVGQHDGLMFYTIGQRQGLKIGGRKNSSGAPWYVVAKNLEENTLIVAQGHDHPALFKQELHCTQTHWIAGNPPSSNFACTAKIRYRHTDQACHVTQLATDHYHVKFSIPQSAVTPGQSIVFYDGEVCLGGAIIV